MKRIIALLLCISLCIAMCACGTKEAKTEDQTITVWYYADAGTGEVYEQWGEKVHELYPNITLEFEELPYDSGPEKFTIACGTGTTPDIYIDGYSRIAPAVNAGLALDLTDVFDANKSLYLAEPADGIVENQRFYLATHLGTAYGMMYNKDLAEKLGVLNMIPQGFDPWSYEDFLNVCRAAKAADPNIIPFNLYAGSQSSDAWYYSMYMANGAELLNKEHNAAVFNDGENKEKITETLDFFKTLIDENLVPAGVATMTDEDGDSLFCSNQLLFEASGGWGTSTYFYGLAEQGNAEYFTFDSAVMPTKDGNATPDSGSWGSYGFCAFDNGTGKIDTIKTALNVYLQNPELHSQICTLVGKASVLNTTVIEYPTENITSVMSRGAEYSAVHGRSDFGILEPWWTDFRMTHYPQMQEFYTGKIDAATMLQNWYNEASKVIPQK